MLSFLQTESDIKEVTTSLGEGVKEKIVGEQHKITSYLDNIWHDIMMFAPKLLWALCALLIGLWLIKRISLIAEKAMLKRQLEVSLKTFLKSLLSIGLKIILIVIVAGMLGIGTTSFVTILGAAGLAIGLALQGSLANFAGGVLILIFKPFKVGDTIEAQNMIGEVKEIQIFNTILLTLENKTVILPNGPLSNGVIVNNTRFGSLRVDISLSISSNNNIEKVKGIINQVLETNEKVLREPAAGIVIGKVADAAINLNVRPFCHPDHTGPLTSELYYQLHLAFEQNGVLMPPIIKSIQTTI